MLNSVACIPRTPQFHQKSPAFFGIAPSQVQTQKDLDDLITQEQDVISTSLPNPRDISRSMREFALTIGHVADDRTKAPPKVKVKALEVANKTLLDRIEASPNQSRSMPELDHIVDDRAKASPESKIKALKELYQILLKRGDMLEKELTKMGKSSQNKGQTHEPAPLNTVISLHKA